MKTKELIQLVVAVLIFAVAGFLIFMQVGPKGGSQKTLTYEKITPIEPDYNGQALNRLTDVSQSKNFYTPPDLKSGIGNPSPFAPPTQ